jgi:nitroreductase
MLERILTNGTWAPNHGMTQPWRFKVFEGDSGQDLGDILSSVYQAETPTDLYLQRKADGLSQNPRMSSVTVALCMKRQASGKISELDELMAVACCVQNMHLTCTAYGLGAFWSTPAIMSHPGVHDYLRLDEDERCLGFFYIGYPSGDWPKGYRTPLAEHVDWRGE